MAKLTDAQLTEKASELVSCLEIWGLSQDDALQVSKRMKAQIIARPYAKWNVMGLYVQEPVNLADALPADVNDFLTGKSSTKQ